MTDRSPPPDDNDTLPPDDALQVLAAEYVLGTLDAPARRDIEARLADEGPLRRAVDAWQSRLLPLARLAPPADPSPGLWARIAHSVERAQAVERAGRPAAPAPSPSGWRRGWQSLALWRGLAAAGFAAALLLAVGPRPPGEAPPQYVVVLVAPNSQQPGWVVQAASTRQLRLQPIGAMTIPPDKAMELWTLVEGQPGPVSLGLVPAGRPAQVLLERLPALRENQLFEITLEPPTGSPLGRPSGPILYIGRAVRLAS